MTQGTPPNPDREIPQDPDDELIGKVVARRYRIERQLGRGGMGTVYYAEHMTLRKGLALKVLHPEYARKPELVERFLQEAKAASRIRHENIIDVTDFGITEQKRVFFAMEQLEGEELHAVLTRALLDQSFVPWKRCKNIFLQVCSALKAAHDQGIVHRDLKPENVFLIEWLGQSDFVKLLDFGIAKVTDLGEDARKLTKTGMLFGTPEYMAPEQAKGLPIDHRVDIYAMGCILFQMVTGRVPFDADNFLGILTKHLSDPVPVMGSHLERVGAPAALEDIVRKAMAKDPDRRYQTAEELAYAIRTTRHDTPTQSGPRRRQSGWTGEAQVLSSSPASVTVLPENPEAGRGWLKILAIGGGVGVLALGLALALAGGGGAELPDAGSADSAPLVQPGFDASAPAKLDAAAAQGERPPDAAPVVQAAQDASVRAAVPKPRRKPDASPRQPKPAEDKGVKLKDPFKESSPN